MKNIDAIIYTKNLFDDLDKNEMFNPENDLFLDRELLYVEVLKIADKNITEYDDPALSEDELIIAIQKVRENDLKLEIRSMVEKGELNIIGISEDGEMLYALNEDFKPELKKV